MKNTVLYQEKEQLEALFSQPGEIGIVVSGKHNLDTMGASLALYLSLIESGKSVQIVSTTEPIVEISNLVGIDRVKQKFDGVAKTLVISVPYKEGEVEKVSFTTDENRMNFNIVGGQNGITPFSENDIRLIQKGTTPEIIFSMGISHEDELQKVVDLASQAKIVNISFDPNNSLYGDVVLVDPGFSSMSEIITGMIDELNLPLGVDTAQNLLDGLNNATHNFSSPTTSSYAFEAAGLLLRAGAKRQGGDIRKNTQPRIQNIKSTNSIPSTASLIKTHQAQPEPTQLQQPEQPEQTGDENTDVPSDWFVPKVFKGSKNQGQQ